MTTASILKFGVTTTAMMIWMFVLTVTTTQMDAVKAFPMDGGIATRRGMARLHHEMRKDGGTSYDSCLQIHPFQSLTFSTSKGRRRRRNLSTRDMSSSSTAASSSTSKSDGRPDLVDQAMFVAAIERIEDEIAFANAADDDDDWEDLNQDRHEASVTSSNNSDNNNNNADDDDATNTVYAIGRLFVQLPVDRQPELDLTESMGPLVLVTAVYGETAETTGLQVYDTIVTVSVETETNGSGESDTGGVSDGDDKTGSTTTTMTTFHASTKQMTLEQTAAVLTAAAKHALDNGKKEIRLELNRLIRGYYAPSKG